MNDDCRAPNPSWNPQIYDDTGKAKPLSPRGRVYEAIDSERYFQDRKWGTIAEHPHEVGGWLTIMRQLLRDAEKAWASSADDYTATVEIRKVIAVGVACLEQHGVQTRSKFTEIEKRGK